MEVRTLSLKADGDLMHKVAAQVSELRVKNKSTKEHGLTVRAHDNLASRPPSPTARDAVGRGTRRASAIRVRLRASARVCSFLC
eukprot:6204234-Pleurochrysis_carterae.AAC.3